MYCKHIADLLAVPDGRDSPYAPAFVADYKGATIVIAALETYQQARDWALRAEAHSIGSATHLIEELPDYMDHSGLKHRHIAVVTANDVLCEACFSAP